MKLWKSIRERLPQAARKSAALGLTACFLLTAFSAAFSVIFASAAEPAVLTPEEFTFNYAKADEHISASSFGIAADPTDTSNSVLQLNGTGEKAPVPGKANPVFLTADGTADGIYRLTPGNKWYAFSMEIYLPENSADSFAMSFGALNTGKTALSYNQKNYSSYNTADYQLIYAGSENIRQQKIASWGNRVEFSGFKTGKWVTVAGYFKTTLSFTEGPGLALSVDCANIAEFKPCFDNIKIYPLDISKSNLILNTRNSKNDIIVLQGTEGQTADTEAYLTNSGYRLLGCYNYAKTPLSYGSGSWGACAELDTSDGNRFTGKLPAAGISMACAAWEKEVPVKTYELSFADYPETGEFVTDGFTKSKDFAYDGDGASLKFDPGDGAAQWSAKAAYLNDSDANFVLNPNKIYAFSFYWYMPADVIGLGGGPEMQFIAAGDLSLEKGTYQGLATKISMGDRGQANTLSWQGKVSLSNSAPPRGKWVKQVGYFTTGNNLNYNKLAIKLSKTNLPDKKFEMYIDCLSVTEISAAQSVVIIDSENENMDSAVLYGAPSSEMSVPTFNKSEFKAAGYYSYNLADSAFPAGKSFILASTAQKLPFTEVSKFPSAAGATIVQIEWEWDPGAAKTYRSGFEDYPSDGEFQGTQFVKSRDYALEGEYSLKTASPDGLATWHAFSGKLNQGNDVITLKPGKIYAYDFYTYIPADNLYYNSGVEFSFAGIDEKGAAVQLETRASMDAAAGQQNLQGGKNILLFTPNKVKGVWVRQNGYFITPPSLTADTLGMLITKTVAADKTQTVYFDKMQITEIDGSQAVVVVNTENADDAVRVYYGKPSTTANIGSLEYTGYELKGWYTFNIAAGANRKPSDSRIAFGGVDGDNVLTLPDKAGATVIYADWQLDSSIDQGDDVTVGFEDYAYTGTVHANRAFSKNTVNFKSGSASLECNRYAEQDISYSATHINVGGAPYLLENNKKYVIDFWYCVESNYTDVINLRITASDRNNPHLGLVAWEEYTYMPGEPLAIRYKGYKTGVWYHFTTSVTAEVIGDADALTVCWRESRVGGRTENSGMTMLIDDFRIRRVDESDSYIYVSMGVDGVSDPLLVGKAGDKVKLPAPQERASYVFDGWETYKYIRSDELKGYVKEGKPFDGDNAVLPENFLYVYAKWRRVSFIQDFEAYAPNSYFNSIISDMEIYSPGTAGYNSGNVHGGQCSLHRKGKINSARAVGMYTDEDTMLETAKKYRFKLWVKLVSAADKNATLQYVNAKSANIPGSADMDPVDLVRLSDLKVGKWEWVSAEFTTVDRYLSLIIPAGCELYIDDIILVKDGDPWPEKNVKFELSAPVISLDDGEIPEDDSIGDSDIIFDDENADSENGKTEETVKNTVSGNKNSVRKKPNSADGYIIIDIWQIVSVVLCGVILAGATVSCVIISRKNKKTGGK